MRRTQLCAGVLVADGNNPQPSATDRQDVFCDKQPRQACLHRARYSPHAVSAGPAWALEDSRMERCVREAPRAANRTRSANCCAVSSSSIRAGGRKYTSHTTAQLVISLNCGVTQARLTHARSQLIRGMAPA